MNQIKNHFYTTTTRAGETKKTAFIKVIAESSVLINKVTTQEVVVKLGHKSVRRTYSKNKKGSFVGFCRRSKVKKVK